MINQRDHGENEKGMALISALLMATILLALGLAITMSATTDTIIGRSHRISEQAFFAADAGIAIARKALGTALQEEIQKIQNGTAGYGEGGFYKKVLVPGEFPDVQVIPDPDTDPDHPFFQNVYARARQLSSVPARSARLRELNGTSFTAEFRPLSGSIELLTSAGNSETATETAVLRYTIEVVGTTEAGGRASVVESGLMSLNINLTNGAVAGTDRRFSFSGFGAFFDYGDTAANAALAAGTFTGPVHTNTHFAYRSNRIVRFRNVVSQVDNYIRYDSNNMNEGHIAIPTENITGIEISSEGYRMTNHVPLPDNSFSQEYAVINGTGITDLREDGSPVDPPGAIPLDGDGNELPVFNTMGRVTAEALAANLRDFNNAKPGITGSQINNGVYLSSSDGGTITGAGIYIQGDAADIQLRASGTDQLYVITQSGVTTTVTVSPSLNRTTIQRGGTTQTYVGVPTDRSDPLNHRPGVSLFVNGSINSLRGGIEGSTQAPAIASDTRLTVTAQRHITITGDLKYADPVLNADGTPVAGIGGVNNVFGIFTNDGNVNLAPNTNYLGGSGLSLEINAAIVAFNSSTQNDAGKIEGSIVYTGGSKPKSTDKWKLVGSRVQSMINNIGYSTRDIFFDVRYSGGSFAPPFFPGTKYDLGEEGVDGDVVISKIDSPKPTGIAWYRDNF